MRILVVFLGIAMAVANPVLVTLIKQGSVDANLVQEMIQQQPAYVIYFIAAPLLLALFAALSGRHAPTPAAEPASASAASGSEPVPAVAPKPTPEAALRLLALLQQEARFVDFIQEDIDAYSDEQVGAAVRSIHAGCRSALAERIVLERVLPNDDGTAVTVDQGFDPAMIRLTGNVTGEPPFRGVLAHGGWRAKRVRLPDLASGIDPTIIAPAEVEIA